MLLPARVVTFSGKSSWTSPMIWQRPVPSLRQLRRVTSRGACNASVASDRFQFCFCLGARR
jgi:hypothetical protein